jgi:hypothetical protein
MYTKEELKQLKAEFWEGFSVYCGNIPAFKGRKSKFMLYNTKMKGVELKFDAGRNGAFVILEINLHDESERLLRFEQFEKHKTIMEEAFPDGLIWDFAYVRESGEEVCRIYTQKSGIDLHRRIHWMQFYEFMAYEMLKLERAFKVVKEAIN